MALIGTVNSGAAIETRVIYNELRRVIDIRQFERITSTGLYTVGKAGVPLGVENIEALIAVLQRALEASRIEVRE